ncbi:hypothetical protein [Aminobacter sp. HY435]|uniref:hypothetical protein n=1 Tax=Aminobacter sp. HY435 TaxID=2970917 RepID=UPI0022B9CCDD|nr:hypothetical protein [Aminobacter sp. HY435]
MSTFRPGIFRAVRHYAGKIRTMQNEIRTERLMNSLPADLRKDIGWPDRFADRRGRH